MRVPDRAAQTGLAAMVAYMTAEEFFITSFWIVVLWTIFTVIGAETVKEEVPTVA